MAFNINKGKKTFDPNNEGFNTKNLAATLEAWGYTVKRDSEVEEPKIFIDDNRAELPLRSQESPGELHLNLIVDMMINRGYSDLDINAALDLPAGLKDSEKIIHIKKFNFIYGHIAAGIEFVPEQMSLMYEEGLLRQIVGSDGASMLPTKARNILTDVDVPSVTIDQIKKSNFEAEIDPLTLEVSYPPGSFMKFHWFVSKPKHVKKLLKAGAPQENIWTPSRILANRFATGRDLTLKEMALMTVGATYEATGQFNNVGIMTFQPVRGFDIKVEHIFSMQMGSKIYSNMWTMTTGDKLPKIFANWQYNPDTNREISPAKMVWQWINFLKNSQDIKDVTGKLALSATSSFCRDIMDYAVSGQSYITMALNTCGIVALTANNKMRPVLVDQRSPQSISDAAEYWLTRKKKDADGNWVPDPVPVSSSALVDTLYCGEGANIRMFGVFIDEEGEVFVRNSNDASKPGKTTNRAQLVDQQTADVIEGDTNTFYHKRTGVSRLNNPSLLEESGLIRAGDKSLGIRMRAIFSNWEFESGSGVAYAHPDLELTISVNKQEKFNDAGIFVGGQDVDMFVAEHFAAFPDAATALENGEPEENVHEAPKGCKVKPGDDLLKFKGVPVCTFGKTDKGMSGYVMGLPKITYTNIEYYPDGEKVKTIDIAGTVPIRVAYNERAAKLRGFGIKATLYNQAIKMLSKDKTEIIEQKDVIFGCETIKQDLGFSALLKAYADTVPGGLDFDANKGLTPEQLADFVQWKEDNTKEAWFYTPPMKPRQYQLLKAKKDGKEGYEFDDATRTIGQLVTYIEADIVLAIEVSTVRENMGVQGLIGEGLVTLATINSDLALKLWEDNADRREDTVSMLKMAARVPAAERWVNGATNNPELPVFADLLLQKGARRVFEMFHKTFPDGLTIASERGSGKETAVHLRFDALAKFTTKADRIGSTALKLLLHITEETSPDGWSDALNRYLGMINGGLKSWISSPGVLKGLTRTDKIMFGRKVKTIDLDYIADDEVGINPNDPLVIQGKIKDGDWLYVTRSPMISMVLLRAKVTDKAPIGTFLIDSLVWHEGNEGDGDGDGIAGLLAARQKADESDDEFKARVEKMQKRLNNSFFGQKGYYTSWANKEVPFLDFFDGANKKSFFAPYNPEKGIISLQRYVQILRSVGSHYTIFVGKAFSMASALTFRHEYEDTRRFLAEKHPHILADEGHDPDEILDNYNPGVATACAKVWRRIYEGLALSGISDIALFAAEKIQRLGSNNTLRIGATESIGDVNVFDMLKEKEISFKVMTDDKTGEKFTMFEGIFATQVLFDLIDIDLTVDEADAMLWSIVVTSIYSKIEKAGLDNSEENKNFDQDWAEFKEELPDHMQDEFLLNEAIIYGTLRRAGAGLWENSRYEDGTSLVSLVTPEMIDFMMPDYSLTGAILKAAAPALADVNEILKSIEKAEYSDNAPIKVDLRSVL
jgi:hypothetical protein